MAHGHTEEFRRETARIALTSGLTRKLVASDLSICFSTLAKWTQKSKPDDLPSAADIDLGFNTWRRNEPLRLYGIDAPEPKGETSDAGKAATAALASRIEGKELVICTIKDRTGKFGRYLVKLYQGDLDINQWMIEAGHAVRYQ